MDQIRIRGARTHNLKNLNVDLPRNRLIVITGLSGSGKSSLAFDTLYAEGQRRYVESLSAYARQFLQLMEKPDVDLIEGLSPAISIEQKAASHNPRSTVGTITEIHDYLRLLYARVGTPYCPQHKLPLEAQSVSQMVDHALALPEDTRLMILAPIVASRKGEQHELVAELRAQARRRPRRGARARFGPRARLLGALRLPGLRLLAARTRTAPFLLQQSRGRLPGVRRPGHDQLLRSQARGRAPGLEPRQRRDQGLGPAQPVLFPDAHEPRRPFPVRRRGAVRETPRAGPDARALRHAGENPVLLPERARPHDRERSRLRGHPAQ